MRLTAWAGIDLMESVGCSHIHRRERITFGKDEALAHKQDAGIGSIDGQR